MDTDCEIMGCDETDNRLDRNNLIAEQKKDTDFKIMQKLVKNGN